MAWLPKSVKLGVISQYQIKSGKEFWSSKVLVTTKPYLKLVQSLVKKPVYTKLPMESIFQMIK